MSDVIISNPADQKKIRDAMQEISNAKARITGEREFIKEAIADLHENFKEVLSKKQLNKMAKIYHLGTLKQEVEAMEEFEIIYRNALGVTETD